LPIAPSPEIVGVISGTLDHIPIDQHSSYEALSYTWADDRNGDTKCGFGNDEDPYIFTRGLLLPCREQPLRSSTSIQTAFLRRDDFGSTLYASICINQSDLVERSEKVSIMKMLYVDAMRTVYWIGQEFGTSRAAFKILHTLP
jgi:hypothetical protein